MKKRICKKLTKDIWIGIIGHGQHETLYMNPKAKTKWFRRYLVNNHPQLVELTDVRKKEDLMNLHGG